MRTREIKKNFYINYNEQDLLKNKCSATGLSEAEFIRCLIRGFIPREKPGKDFYEEIKNLRQIGNNLNQLTKYANTTGRLRESEIIKVKELVEKTIYDLQKKYLMKEELNIIIQCTKSVKEGDENGSEKNEKLDK